MKRRKEKGQALAEFAFVMPILILLLFGMTFAAFYAFRSASTDWGVFITGVASGSYDTPMTEHARENVLWPDLAHRINAGQSGARQVRSLISVEDSRSWIFGIRLTEAQRAANYFRLWRFYPGPPNGGVE
ncbi:MAG: pilus assembly protein [Anaerolineales bacterium]|nr:pilus assembly protein [Anaerolineales bacterium]